MKSRPRLPRHTRRFVLATIIVGLAGFVAGFASCTIHGHKIVPTCTSALLLLSIIALATLCACLFARINMPDHEDKRSFARIALEGSEGGKIVQPDTQASFTAVAPQADEGALPEQAAAVAVSEERNPMPPPLDAELRRIAEQKLLSFGLDEADARIGCEILAGLKYSDIAQLMNFSTSTVKRRARIIYAKSGAGSREELVGAILGSPDNRL